MAYIYLLQDGEYIGTNIYKIGRTVQTGGDTRKLKRFRAYSKGTVVYNTWKVNEYMLNSIEKNIKDVFVLCFNLMKGTEWFQGNVKDMKREIDTIIDSIDEFTELKPDIRYHVPNSPIFPATYGEGFTYFSTKDITKNDFIELCETLDTCTTKFEPERIAEGGILYKFSHEVPESWYKSVRLGINVGKGWPDIFGDEMTSWKYNNDIILEKNKFIDTWLKSFGGAPPFTFDEITQINKVLCKIGLKKCK